MLHLRPFQNSDAEHIAGWIKNEEALRLWSADRFDSYPVTADMICEKYREHRGKNGTANFYPLTAVDKNETVTGHLFIRFTDSQTRILRFGFVIVDNTKRGLGYGKEMLDLALIYAFKELNAHKVTLGVFEKNPAALHCYQAVGFRDALSPLTYDFSGEKWNCIEMEINRDDFF